MWDMANAAVWTGTARQSTTTAATSMRSVGCHAVQLPLAGCRGAVQACRDPRGRGSHPGHQWEISMERATGWLCGAVRGAPRSVAAGWSGPTCARCGWRGRRSLPGKPRLGQAVCRWRSRYYYGIHLSWRRLDGVGILEAVRGHWGEGEQWLSDSGEDASAQGAAYRRACRAAAPMHARVQSPV